jgi:hypothetical protein
MGLAAPEPLTADAIDDMFRADARDRKGEFAYALANRIREALAAGTPVVTPPHIEALLAYLYPDTAEIDGPAHAAGSSD